MLVSMFKAPPTWFKVAWFAGVALSLTVVGVVISALIKFLTTGSF